MSKLNPVGKMLALEIAPKLATLWEKHPGGFTIKVLQAATGLAYDEANQAFHWIHELKLGRVLMRPDRFVLMCVPLDWTPPAWGLTRKQRATLDWLADRADAEGLVAASYRDICRGALLSKGGIVAHLYALDKKGYLRFVDRGGHHRKTTLRVFPEGNATGESVWPQAWELPK